VNAPTHYVSPSFLVTTVIDAQNPAAVNQWTIPQTVSDTLPALETSVRKPYGFLNAYTGYFLHVGGTANEINELGVDAETLSPSERRNRRLRHEESKWDPEHYMYVRGSPSTIIIPDLIVVSVRTPPPSPHLQGGLCRQRADRRTHRMDAPASRIAFDPRRHLHRSRKRHDAASSSERMYVTVILFCIASHHLTLPHPFPPPPFIFSSKMTTPGHYSNKFFFLGHQKIKIKIIIIRPRLAPRHPRPLPDSPDAPLRIRLRRAHNAARSNSRKRMDDRGSDASLLRARSPSLPAIHPSPADQGRHDQHRHRRGL
jgi:hypothetical protein